MTERIFRLVMGVWLVLALLSAMPAAIEVLIGLLLFEGMTNWRIPILFARLRKVADQSPPTPSGASLIPFEAERALRLIVVLFLVLALFVMPEPLWWLPWLVGFALIGAGLSGICPMVQALRWAGLR